MESIRQSAWEGCWQWVTAARLGFHVSRASPLLSRSVSCFKSGFSLCGKCFFSLNVNVIHFSQWMILNVRKVLNPIQKLHWYSFLQFCILRVSEFITCPQYSVLSRVAIYVQQNNQLSHIGYNARKKEQHIHNTIDNVRKRFIAMWEWQKEREKAGDESTRDGRRSPAVRLTRVKRTREKKLWRRCCEAPAGQKPTIMHSVACLELYITAQHVTQLAVKLSCKILSAR